MAEAHGVTARPVVGRHRDRGVGCGDRPPGVGGDERLVAEADDDGRRAELTRRVDAAAQ